MPSNPTINCSTLFNDYTTQVSKVQKFIYKRLGDDAATAFNMSDIDILASDMYVIIVIA